MVEDIRQGDIPGVQLRCRQQLAATPEEVWKWLTEPGRLERWLAQRAEITPGPKASLLLESQDTGGEVYREQAQTMAWEPPSRWVLDFQRLDAGWTHATRLTLELTPNPAGTDLSVLQTGFAHLPLSDCLTIWETYRRRWRTALSRLAHHL